MDETRKTRLRVQISGPDFSASCDEYVDVDESELEIDIQLASAIGRILNMLADNIPAKTDVLARIVIYDIEPSLCDYNDRLREAEVAFFEAARQVYRLGNNLAARRSEESHAQGTK